MASGTAWAGVFIKIDMQRTSVLYLPRHILSRDAGRQHRVADNVKGEMDRLIAIRTTRLKQRGWILYRQKKGTTERKRKGEKEIRREKIPENMQGRK